MTNLVSTCIMLHNMYTIEKDKFDLKWIEETKTWLKMCIKNISNFPRKEFKRPKEGQEMRATRIAISEVRIIIIKKYIKNIKDSQSH